MNNIDTVLNVFNEINKRKICSQCRSQRACYKDGDTDKLGNYSNLSLGFFSYEHSQKQSLFDVMIVLESHGGGDIKQGFKSSQLVTEMELKGMKDYYLKNKLVKFHQQQIRKLIVELQQLGYTYVVTDLVKCFVKKGKDKKTGIDYNPNIETAISHCSSYLQEQIIVFKPKIIIGLGKNVSRKFFGLEPKKHSEVLRMIVEIDPFQITSDDIHEKVEIKCNSFETQYIHSLFPSRNTADYWVQNGEWEPVILKIKELL